MYLDPANLAWCTHSRLTTIREKAFGALQYLNLGMKMVVGPFDSQDIDPYTSRTVFFQIPVKHLPREVCGRK